MNEEDVWHNMSGEEDNFVNEEHFLNELSNTIITDNEM